MQKCHHLSTWTEHGATRERPAVACFLRCVCGVFVLQIVGGGLPLAGYFLHGSSSVQSGFSRASLGLNRAKILSLRSWFKADFLVLRPCFKAVNRRRSGPLPHGFPCLVRVRFEVGLSFGLRSGFEPLTADLMPTVHDWQELPTEARPKTGTEIARTAHNAPKTPSVRFCALILHELNKPNKTPYKEATGQIRPFERFTHNTTKTPDQNRGFSIRGIV